MRTLPFSFRALVLAAAPQLGASAGDALAARAVACAGLAAVLGLPLLLLASLVLDAPLAVPASIASGYLAISHALASNRPHRAAFISGLVLAALVGWLILFLAEGDEPLSRTEVTAALLAPLFAAAPAFARSVMAPRATVDRKSVPPSREAALQRVACLDELAPSELVLITDEEGCVLAATRAARQRLRLLPEAFELHVASIFEPADLPEVTQALRNCAARGETVEFALDELSAGEGSRTVGWMASPGEGGAVSLRLLGHAPVALPASKMRSTSDEAEAEVRLAAMMSASPMCDIGEAVAFALRRARPRGTAKGVAFAVACDAELVAVCDRQVGRRITHLSVEAALAAGRAGDAIHVDARRLKGIVLLRITLESMGDADAADADGAFEFATLRTSVEDAGGTLVIDRQANRRVLSVRLALSDDAIGKKRVSERAEAA